MADFQTRTIHRRFVRETITKMYDPHPLAFTSELHIYAASFFWNIPSLKASMMGKTQRLLSGCSFIFSAHFSLNLSIMLDLNGVWQFFDTYRYSTSRSSGTYQGRHQIYRRPISLLDIYSGLRVRTRVCGHLTCYLDSVFVRYKQASTGV
jgi:hypothetical protein